MYEELNNSIIEAKENLRKKQYLQGKFSNAQGTLRGEKARLQRLSEELQKENLDVEKLEKVSLSGLLYTILGKKEERLDKERQEYFTAKLKYEECRNSVQALEKEVSYIRSSLNEYRNCEDKYEELLDLKENYILQNGGANAEKLFEYSYKIGDLQADLRELKEAAGAGEKAKSSLVEVYDALGNAENWGSWDMFGGGFISTHEKYSAIDEANEYAIEAQAMLRILSNELKDVELNYDIELNIGDFDRFADYFFDGILADWSVQSQIQDSLTSVEDAIAGVSSVIGVLEARVVKCEEGLEKLKEEASNLIENIK